MAVTDHGVRGNEPPNPGDQLEPAGALRYQRVVIDLPDLQLTVDAHPMVTVVAVPHDLVGRTARTLSLALTNPEPGVHCEISDADGRNLLLFRPYGARPRVIDLDSQQEVAPPTAAADTPTSEESAAGPAAADALRNLSAIEQAPLWAAAERLSAASTQGAQVLHEVESKSSHTHRFPFGRKSARERRAGNSTRSVADALRLLEQAGADWRALAGDIPLPLALALRPGIEACADARSRTAALATMAAGRADHLSEQAIGSAVDVVAAVLAGDPHLPQVLVLPPPEVGRLGLQLTLDLLPGLMTGRQVLVVTSSADVADWGRLESHADRAAVTIYGA
jgi:hypothetical protein